MEFVKLSENDIEKLKPLQTAYKLEIGESAPSDGDFDALAKAIAAGQILFFGCRDGGRLIACCSVSPVFSTFDYKRGGVFEDFYIVPEYRHKGIARQLVLFAYGESGASSLTVGCADCDAGMYRSLGFDIPLGNLLAFDANTAGKYTR